MEWIITEEAQKQSLIFQWLATKELYFLHAVLQLQLLMEEVCTFDSQIFISVQYVIIHLY